MNLREAAQQALNALELGCTDHEGNKVDLVGPAITALRAALAEEKNENTVQSTGGVHSRVSDGANRGVEAVTDCHEKEGDKLSPPLDVPETNFGNMAQSVDSTRSAHIANASKMVEPVAWRFYDGKIWCYVNHISDLSASTKFEPLYPAPPKRKPLTDKEIQECVAEVDDARLAGPITQFARAIERSHGIGGEE